MRIRFWFVLLGVVLVSAAPAAAVAQKLTVKAPDDVHVYVRRPGQEPRYAFTGSCTLCPSLVFAFGSEVSYKRGASIELGAGFRHEFISFSGEPLSIAAGETRSVQVELRDRRALRRFTDVAQVGGIFIAAGGLVWALSDPPSRSPGSYILIGGGALLAIIAFVLEGRGDKPKLTLR